MESAPSRANEQGMDGPPGGATAQPAPDQAASSSGGARWLLDPVLLGCFALLLAFPLVAAAAAARQPLVAASGEPRLPAAGKGPKLRDVPAFTDGGAAAAAVAGGRVLADQAAMRRALREAMDELLGGRDTAPLEALVGDSSVGFSFSEPEYPFRFPRLDEVLDRVLPPELDTRQAEAANDLGALLVLAAARFPELSGAPPLAFAILDRARAERGCLPQLNLAFLLSTHVRPRDEETGAEFRRAERSCSGDPTPLWLLGQFQSQRALLELSQPESEDAEEQPEQEPQPPRETLRSTFQTFHRLQRRFPDSSAGWAGEGDAEVRAAYQLDARQPFSARSRFRRALSLYRRAAALDPDPAIAVGEARAYAGLRLFGRAVRAQRGALGRAPRLAPLRARLVEYLEQDRRFAEAAVAAAALAAAAEFPEGPGLFMQIDVGGGRLEEEDANEPLSLGSERLLAVGLEVAPIGTPSGGRVGVVDLSFIPQFRAVEGLTGYHRWCPEWSRRRDLVLAGRPGDALDGMPDRFTDIRPGGGDDDCPVEASVAVPLLAGVAELEAGDRDAAVERLRSAGFDAEGRRPLVVLHDARQNLWRFAGDLGRAGAAAAAWTRVAPTSALAFDRPGEIAFLAEDYDRAASLFGVSLRLARSAAGTWSLREAEALLKRGTALEFAGRHAEALADLADSDEVASRVFAASSHEDEDPLAGTPAAYVSYNARLQAGDTHLRGRRYAAAREQYAAARERERDVADVAPGEPLRRPEVLDNNEALVQVQLGELGEALQAARRALQADPLSPIFLQNLGFTLYRLGRPEQAADAYRAAARADPTLFPAWNDLGVVLANEGRLAEAARAFRRAVGARSDYGLGWFNLGVALERLGPLHAPASQGAFGRAFRADPDLRGRARTFVADDHLYVTALDLSKPLPPRWEFARTQERAPLAVAGFALALLLGLQLGRTAAGPRLGGDARRWLELTRDFLGRLPRALVSTTAALAVAATVAVFLDPAAALA